MKKNELLFDELIKMFQSSLHKASERLQNEEKGDLRYTVTNCNVELSAAVQGDKENREPRLRLPTFTELAEGKNTNYSRISLGFSPIPFNPKKTDQVINSPSRPTASDSLSSIIDKLKHEDKDIVIEALNELQHLDTILLNILNELKRLRKHSNKKIQKSAKKIIELIQNLD